MYMAVRKVYRRKLVNRAPKRAYAVAKKAVKAVLSKELELKRAYFTGSVALSTVTIGTTDVAAIDLGQIAQGVTNNQRIGNKIRIHSIKWRLGVSHNATAGTLRVCAVRTKTNAFAGSSMPINMETFHDKDRVMVLSDRNYKNDSSCLWKLLTGSVKGNYLQFDDTASTSATKGTTFLGFRLAGNAGVTLSFGYQIEVTYTDA